MRILLKLVAISLLVLFAFMFGANQHRINGWPFNRGYLIFGQPTFNDRKKQISGWVEKLRKGGYILYFRHASREKWPEVAAFDIYALTTNLQDPTQTAFKRAVCLSDQGIEEAKLIGKILQLSKIPVGTIVSSPSCRAKQTATYAFGKIDKLENAVLTDGLSSEKVRTLLLNVDIKPGTNTVFTGHTAGNKGDGEILALDETGFHIIERKGKDKLTVVYSVKSISDLAVSTFDLPLK